MVAIDEQKFVHLLESILQGNTENLKTATATLRSDYYVHPESLLLLVNIIKSHPTSGVRQLAAVEARTLVPAFWPASEKSESQIPANIKADIRSSLLQATVNEPEPLVKHSSARVISAIAKIDLPQGEWIDLPKFLSEAAVSAKAIDREIGVYVLYTLLETLEGKFSDRWADFFQLFARTINDSESLPVRMNTLLALGKMAEFLDADDDADSVRSFRGLLPSMVEVLKQVIATGDDTMADQAFDVFLTLLSADSSLTANHFKDLVQFMMELSTNAEISEDTRILVLNFLIGCVRMRRLKVQSMKVGETLTLLALKISAESEDEDPDDDNTLSRTAVLLINFLAESLPPSQVVVPLMNNLGPYVQSENPNYRRAAITAIGGCVEGAPDFVATQIQHIVPLVTKLLQDQNLQVRRASLITLANLADELGAEIGKYHADLIPLLIRMLESQDGLEIWKSSCHAIDALLDEVEVEQVQSYLPSLMPRLSAMFTNESNDIKLQAAAIGGISSTARGAKATFMPYFESTMRALGPFLTIKDSEDEINLRSAVMDCVGSIAEAVGQEAFTPYVPDLMRSAEEALHLGNSRAKETAFYFFSVLARVYKDEFAPFLATVMPPLFESLEASETEMDDAELSEEVKSLLVKELNGQVDLEVPIAIDDLNDFDEDDDWEELAAVTAIALEKEVAIDSMGEILTHCTKGYLPYLEKTVELLVDKSGHMYEGVRKSAIDTLWRAYAALWQVQGDSMAKWEPGLPLKTQPTKELEHLGAVVINCTLAFWKDEEDREVVTAIGHNMGEVLKMCGPAILSDKDGAIILETITQLQLVLSKQHVCQIEAAEEDDLDLGESSEYDWLLVESSLDCTLGLAAALGPAFGDAWKILGPSIVKYASSSEHLERSHSLGVIADTIRYMGEGVTPHTVSLMKLLLHRLSDEDPETKSNAAYATGLLCEKSTNVAEVTKNYPAILQKLEPLLHTEGSRILDNACGCVARMVSTHEAAVGPLEQVLGALVDLLPLKEDFEENEPIYGMFVHLYKSHNQVVFSMTPRLMPIFSSVLTAPAEEEMLTLEVRQGLIEVVQYIGSKEPGMVQQYPDLVSLMG